MNTADKLNAAYGPTIAYLNAHPDPFWSTYDACGLITTILGAIGELDDSLPEHYDGFRPEKNS